MLVLNGVFDAVPADDFLNLEAVTMFKQTSQQYQDISAKNIYGTTGSGSLLTEQLGRDTLDRHGLILAHSRDKFSERTANYFRENCHATWNIFQMPGDGGWHQKFDQS